MRLGSSRVALALAAVLAAGLAGAVAFGHLTRAARTEPPRAVLAAVVVTRVPASSASSAPALPAPAAIPAARTPVVAPQVSVGSTPFLPLDEAIRLAPFPIGLPSVVPPGMAVRDAIVSTPPPGAAAGVGGRVIVSYAPAAGPGGFGLDQARGPSTRADGADLFPYVIPLTHEPISVNGQIASYFRGAWHVAPASAGAPGASTFDAGADVGLLHWRDGDMAFRLQQSGLRLTRDDLIRIAESVR